MSKRYRALTGLTYPENPRLKRENWEWKRVEAGEIVDDIPTKSVPWLLDGSRIEVVTDDDGEVDASGEAGE